MKIRAQVDKNVHDVEIEREDGLYAVAIDGTRHVVDAQALEGDAYSILMDGRSYEITVSREGDGYHVRHGGFGTTVRFADPARGARQAMAAAEGPQKIRSVMPGKVVRVLVQVGDVVEQGQGLVVVEAMKMENEMESPKAGTITAIEVRPGQAVESGAVLVVVD